MKISTRYEAMMALIEDTTQPDAARLVAANALTNAILRDRVWWKAHPKPIPAYMVRERQQPGFIHLTYAEWRQDVEAANRLLRKHDMGKKADIKPRTSEQIASFKGTVRRMTERLEEYRKELVNLQYQVAYEHILTGGDINDLDD